MIASQSGHRLPALTLEQDRALAMTPAEALLLAGPYDHVRRFATAIEDLAAVPER